MKFDVLTLFPDIIYNYLNDTILSRAQRNNLIKVAAHNIRDFSGNKWGHVDDKPYGGGAGMILRIEPIYECLKSLKVLPQLSFQGATRRGISVGLTNGQRSLLRRRDDKTRVIIMDPAGKKFDQRMAEKFSRLDRLIIISGRYEGFDARVYDLVDERVSVGGYVLAGGELPALTIIEATSRLIPGVLGNQDSLKEESFTGSTKEYPQYTKPVDFKGQKVPKVLLSGNHKNINDWRKKESL